MTAYGLAKRVADISPGPSLPIVGVGGIGSSLILMAKAPGAAMIVAADIAGGQVRSGS